MVWASAPASKCILSFQFKAFPLRKYADIKRNARAHGFGITNILSLIFFLFLTEVK